MEDTLIKQAKQGKPDSVCGQVERFVSKPKHPAVYTDKFIPIFADKLNGCSNVYDPFAGTGKIALIKEYGFSGEIYCCEIEPEWTRQFDGVDFWFIGDSAGTKFLPENKFDAICTSPTYGNRMADHFNAKDSSKRITYRHFLGHPLKEENTGRMQWGEKYQNKHIEIYNELSRVLKVGGKFILNISDHIRKGEIVNVSDWHKNTLIRLGFNVIDDLKIETPRMGFGQNRKLRVSHERIIELRKAC